MSAPAFTPGPWLVHSTKRLICQADGAFADVTVKDGKVYGEEGEMRQSICLLRDPSEGFSEDETLANGFLIAAAPELYEALSEMVGLYGTCAELEECAACSKAIAALAKARGDA